MPFSERTAWDPEESEYAAALRSARATRRLVDLTVSNPTRCGFAYDSEMLLAPLRATDSLQYNPLPFGLPTAREAVAAYYRDHGANVPPEHVCLTTSTSEAYGFLFQLLCDPGDEVLIARPSYPLFDFLARLHDVRLREYPLFYDPGHHANSSEPRQGAWSIDLTALEESLTARTRAILVVHPNNPTGNFVSGPERFALERLCAKHGVALIVDEVFLDYALPGTQPHSFVAGESPALCFVLSGVSKVCALPQMKLSWIAARGPEPVLREALGRLEIIADTYLSLNAPVQHALPAWLAQRASIQQQIRERMVANLAVLDRRLERSMATRLPLEGGWTAILRVPREVDGREFALLCLERGVIVQPGELYGLPAGRIVLSLLTPADVWAEGLALLPVD